MASILEAWPWRIHLQPRQCAALFKGAPAWNLRKTGAGLPGQQDGGQGNAAKCN